MARFHFYLVIALSLIACGPTTSDSRAEESTGADESGADEHVQVSEGAEPDTCGELFGHGCEWQYEGSSMDPSIEPHYVCGWRPMPGDSARATEGATPPACGPHCCDEPMPELPQ